MPDLHLAELNEQAAALLKRYRQAGLKIATAESCTGGLIAGCLTNIAGSSAVFERGFVTYSNEAKEEAIDVPADLIARHGAVSAEVAEAMAAGALARSQADVAVSSTGIAGPDGGSAEKPVGLVFIGICRRGTAAGHQRRVFPGDRDQVRLGTVQAALALLSEQCWTC
jgi:nicotinamide-nucleotide amidase